MNLCILILTFRTRSKHRRRTVPTRQLKSSLETIFTEDSKQPVIKEEEKNSFQEGGIEMDNLCPNNYNGGIEFETAAGENNKNGISKITSVATVTATDDGNMVDYTVI